MKEMQRWKVIDDDLMRPDEQPHGIVPDEVFLEVVLASDAETAIAAAENAFRGAEQAWYRAGEAAGYERGKQDMLAKCIAAVDARIRPTLHPLENAGIGEALAALRALEEKP